MAVTFPTLSRDPSPASTQNNNTRVQLIQLGGGYINSVSVGTQPRSRTLTLVYDFLEASDSNTLRTFLDNNRNSVIEVPLYFDDIGGSTNGLFRLVEWQESISPNPTLFSYTISFIEVHSE